MNAHIVSMLGPSLIEVELTPSKQDGDLDRAGFASLRQLALARAALKCSLSVEGNKLYVRFTEPRL